MNFPMIDGHMHIAQWENEQNGSVFENIRKYQEDNHIIAVDNMCCSNNGNLWQGFEADQSILGAISKLENDTVFTHGCLYIPENPALRPAFTFRDQLDELMELGLDGIKICDFKPDAYKLFRVEEHLEEYDDFIGYCEKYDVHMCWHIADPEYFWDPDKTPEDSRKCGWFYGDDSYATFERLINLTYVFLDHHPRLHVMLAHMFFKSYQPDEIISLLERYPNAAIDFAPGWGMFLGFRAHHEKWRQIFRKYSDRFLYATDCTLPASLTALRQSAQDVLRFLQTEDEFENSNKGLTRGVGLEQEHLENILYKNHERIVGKKPREINRAALKKYIERYLPLIPASKNTQRTEEYYRKYLL